MAGARAPGAALTLALLACSVDDRTLSVSDAGAAGSLRGVPLLPDTTGFVDGNAAGITGRWYVVADSILEHAPPGSCQTAGGFSDDQCSMVFAPPNNGAPFPPTDLGVGKMCTSGVAAQVIPKASTAAPDFEDIWGAGIGLDFDNAGTSPGTEQPYDARAHVVTGVSFMLVTPPRGSMRIDFPTTDSRVPAAFWNGGASLTSPVTPGLNVIRWAKVSGPYYVSNPPPFDETKLLGIHFSVVANTTKTTPFDFCVSNLTALQD